MLWESVALWATTGWVPLFVCTRCRKVRPKHSRTMCRRCWGYIMWATN